MSACMTGEDEVSSSYRKELYDVIYALLESKEYIKEFFSIPAKSADKMIADCSDTDAKTKNRYANIRPYEETRVKLDVDESRGKSDYINASQIEMTVGGRKMRYVAAQGPLAETTVDFWQMAWENQVNLIIMVTSECFQYWPPDDCKSSVQHGSFCVTSQYFTDSGTTITRRFCLTHSSSTEQRVVWHLEFVGWPDFGVPQCLSTFIAFINEIGSLRRQANSARGNDDTFKPPTVVHCIGGIGRTGVTILTELLLTAVQHNEPISIQHCLKLLRSQRMALVETPEQYRFVHQVLLDYLKHKKQ